jgi:glutathione S-transferase
MTLILYGHPFSSYTQKAQIALYEKGLAFESRELSPDHPENGAAFAALWPIGKFPLLVTETGRPLAEASIIIEYCDRLAPGAAPLIPADPDAALAVRMLDRVFDHYVMSPMQALVGDHLRPADARDPFGCERAREMLDRAYDWLEAELSGRPWAAGDRFTLADCAAAPSLFFADWVHPIGDARPVLSAYRARLNARPSFARCIEEARYFRPFFPPGAPDRD